MDYRERMTNPGTPLLLDVLRTEGQRIASMPADALGAPVPSCPGWTLEHVVRHTGKVHLWVTAVMQAGPGAALDQARPARQMPRGPECLDAYRSAHESMMTEFEQRDLDEPATTFVGPATLRWWVRRQAHEATVHRFDAADAVHTAGGPLPEPADPTAAADGVGEWIQAIASRFLGAGQVPESLLGRTVHLHGTDTGDAEWLLAFTDDGMSVTTEHTKADVALRGSAQQLLLAVWRRRPLDSLQLFGNEAVAEALLDTVQV